MATAAARLGVAGFNRRGDSLGGAALSIGDWGTARRKFQSQGRFFGGCCEHNGLTLVNAVLVSIAGAILWGVLLPQPLFCHCCLGGFNRRGDSLGGAAYERARQDAIQDAGFNRRGDSLGGAALPLPYSDLFPHVSIAGAILWGVLHAVMYWVCRYHDVSIAGAILWGVLPALACAADLQ